MVTPLTATHVEAAAREGRRKLIVTADSLVTPLARDRAAALGVALIDPRDPRSVISGEGARSGAGVDITRLALESRVRVVARRLLLIHGRGLAELESLVAAVMARVADPARCRCREGTR